MEFWNGYLDDSFWTISIWYEKKSQGVCSKILQSLFSVYTQEKLLWHWIWSGQSSVLTYITLSLFYKQQFISNGNQD